MDGKGRWRDNVFVERLWRSVKYEEVYHRWSVLGTGRSQMPIAAMAAAMGGNVRVGLEDSLWLRADILAESNAAQVRQVRRIIEGLGLEVATPDEASEMLELEGADCVGF